MERESICDSHEEDWRELPDGMVYFEEGERGFGLVSYEQNMDTFRMARLTHNTSSTWVGGSGLDCFNGLQPMWMKNVCLKIGPRLSRIK